MLILLGFIAILVSVFGGFMLAGGHLSVLFQPVEFIIIFGAGFGAFIASNNGKGIKATLATLPKLRRSTRYDKPTCMALMALLYEILSKARQEGIMALEADIESPGESELFARYPQLRDDPLVLDFILDYLRLMLSGNMDVAEIEALMDHEIETFEHEAEIPANSLAMVADGMPAFGIVAAVMGVVHALGTEGLEPDQLGPLIAHAMVGTFLGILVAYGFVAPLATRARHQVSEAIKLLQCVKVTMLAHLSGYAPQISVEFGRKALFSSERPSFEELDRQVRDVRGAARQERL
ncbi:flagellar motor stator protein MotA [Halotalea alkalilenta]|uniref:Flagellar motor stator protein MotA n=1 Tax=Halotalea alkalilenta TaxID=376489 RepID=A0A172YKG6_9GAMM|nr:flagellar motor stator protein MotA [Halotalea alkalilenta]ANF59676.1 flagellar motor stator protein MotA [Halotalea alkalilenta]